MLPCLESKPSREAENANVTHKSIPRIRYTGSPIAHQTPTKTNMTQSAYKIKCNGRKNPTRSPKSLGISSHRQACIKRGKVGLEKNQSTPPGRLICPCWPPLKPALLGADAPGPGVPEGLSMWIFRNMNIGFRPSFSSCLNKRRGFSCNSRHRS